MKNFQEETLEEAAENYSRITLNKNGLMSDKQVNGFIAGAKWQAERSYNEDEVDLLIYELIDKFTNWSGSYVNRDVLIGIYEQLKKK
jgi:hypothetical protein